MCRRLAHTTPLRAESSYGTRLLRREMSLHASVGYEPDDGHTGDHLGQPGSHESKREAGEDEDWRNLARESMAESLT